MTGKNNIFHLVDQLPPQPKEVVESEKRDSLQPEHDNLHHTQERVRIVLKELLEGFCTDSVRLVQSMHTLTGTHVHAHTHTKTHTQSLLTHGHYNHTGHSNSLKNIAVPDSSSSDTLELFRVAGHSV